MLHDNKVLLRNANKTITNLREDNRRLSDELKNKTTLLSTYVEVAHEQSLRISSLTAALQDWDPTTCPRPSLCSTPARPPPWTEVVCGRGKPVAATLPSRCLELSNRYEPLLHMGLDADPSPSLAAASPALASGVFTASRSGGRSRKHGSTAASPAPASVVSTASRFGGWSRNHSSTAASPAPASRSAGCLAPSPPASRAGGPNRKHGSAAASSAPASCVPTAARSGDCPALSPRATYGVRSCSTAGPEQQRPRQHLLSVNFSTASDAVDFYNKTLSNILDHHAPTKTRLVSFSRTALWYNSQLRKMKTAGRVLERRFKATGLTIHRLAYREHQKAYSNNFFMARYLEEKDIQNKKEEKSGLSSRSEAVLPSPPSAKTKDKKSVDKGRKSNTAEKSLPPAEPPEPLLCGSLAIGSVSLAVAKTGAQIQDVPFYKYIAALKNKEAVGLGLDYVKLGGLSGAERMTKYNRLISIEEELVQQGILVSKEKRPPPLFTEKPQGQSTTVESPLSDTAASQLAASAFT
ncbi:Enolase 4 [Collichthys lucidus]|uniref:Enolase 4 n=1 Tax=Collichthys lucidus TaxID=240159 RepID=A0A4U5VC73_COLLU|nr:Enolase 4 [Collichthys lucidus]